MIYAKELHLKKTKYHKNLEKEYFKLSENMDNKPSKKTLEEIDRLKNKLDDWYTNKCKGAFIRSRDKWLEFGEKSSKYFLQLEKRNGKKKEINSVKIGSKFVEQGEKILHEIHSFYKHLYAEGNSSSLHDLDTYFKDLNLKFLNEEEAYSCEGLLTEKECFVALQSMGKNKSPGSDGLSVEFYTCFWHNIKQMVVDSLNEGYTCKELSTSQQQAFITLLHKKGDKRCLENWRPISLLNIDYKIAARALSKRLQNVLTSLLSPEQTGFLKKRSALENVRLVQDIIDYCKLTNSPGIIMFLDFKKAFDNVCHAFMFYLLRKLKFKESFVNWVETLYTNAIGRVMNNGWISKHFCIERGVRQGCPLSALLFILVVEVLACKIRQNEKITGISIQHVNHPNTNIKISQYADDTTIFVNSFECVHGAMKDIENFGSIAGPKVNWSKTNIMKLCSLSEFTNDHNIEYVQEPVKCLGIYVGENKEELDHLNWNNKIEKIANILDLWKMRNLTYYGKVIIIKILAASQIVYTAIAVRTPDYVVKQLNKLFYQFIWNSKKEKVKRNVLINPISDGGLNMIDLECKIQSLKLSWISKFFNGVDSHWKSIFTYWACKIGGIHTCFKYNCCYI